MEFEDFEITRSKDAYWIEYTGNKAYIELELYYVEIEDIDFVINSLQTILQELLVEGPNGEDGPEFEGWEERSKAGEPIIDARTETTNQEEMK